MKKLSTKFALAVVLCFALVITVITWFAITESEKIVRSNAETNLVSIVTTHGKDINSTIKEIETIGVNLESIVLSTLDLNAAKADPKYMDTYEKSVDTIFSNAVLKANGQSGWIVFDSKNIPGGHTLSYTQKDGKMNREPEYDIYAGGYDKDAWWAEAVKSGTYWSDPYFWEPWNANIMSYSRKFEKDGVLIGIGGSDYFFDNLSADLAKVKIYDTGYLTLMNGNYDFLSHPNKDYKNLKEIENGAFKGVADNIAASKETSGFVYYKIGNQENIISYYKLNNGWILMASPEMSEVFKDVFAIRATLLLVGGIGILFALVLSVMLGRSIGARINRFGEQFSVSAQGDLTSKIQITSKDELGQMGNSYNEFIEKLATVILEISEVIHRAEDEYQMLSASLDNFAKGKESKYYRVVDDATEDGILQLQHSIENVLDHVSNQVASTEESLAGLEEILATTHGVSDNAKTALSISNNSFDIAKVSFKNVNDMSDNMIQVSQSVTETNTQIDKLTNLSSDIGSITTTINNLSEQTNLLALNAAIEAARAGEAGRGFSVVADEIRKLAELTNKETDKIEEIIKNIQQEILVVKTSNTSVINFVANGTKLTDVVKSDIGNIIEIAKNVNDAMGDISTSSAEQSIATEEITKAVSAIAESSVEIEKIGAHTVELSSNLTEHLLNKLESLDDLNVLLSQLKTDIAFFKTQR